MNSPRADVPASVDTPRPLYRRDELIRLLHPGSVAIVGISPRPGTFGLRTLANLAPFEGRVDLVNGKYERIGELACHPSIAALPEVPDCVAVVVNQAAVEAVVAECIERGVGGVIVYASDYAETGNPEKIALQARLVDRVAGTSTRLLGPNCLGMNNYVCKARVTFGRMPAPRPLGRMSIGLVAQSGALGMALAQAVEHGVSVSHSFTAGNASDVGIADLVGYLAEDPACQVIACLFEGVPEPRLLIAAAEHARQHDKPLIFYKMATGTEGAAAALSHTGTLAGSDAVYRAALSRAGAVFVDEFEDLVETAVFFGKAGRPRARGAVVIVSSGGAGVMAADKAEARGVAMPQPTGATLAVLEREIPEFGAARNPCDVTAQVMTDDKPLHACIDALMGDPAYGCAVVAHSYADEWATARLATWKHYAEKHDKIVCNMWLTQWLEGPGALECEAEPKLAVFRSADRCFAAIAAWHAREERRAAGQSKVAPLVGAVPRAAAAERLANAAATTLTEREAKDVLALYGIPVVAERLARSADEAVRAAIDFAAPVAMKLESPDVPHKTEAGVIRLDLKTPDEVAAGYQEIIDAAGRIQPPPRINGVLVQPMVERGVEVMVGARVDPLFGPLIVVGLGGVFVELLDDTGVQPAPVSPDEALAMLRGLKGVAVLQGFRGSAPVDLQRLADIVARLSEFVADHAGRISEIDVNPLICAGERMTAVDALIVLQPRRTQGAAALN